MFDLTKADQANIELFMEKFKTFPEMIKTLSPEEAAWLERAFEGAFLRIGELTGKRPPRGQEREHLVQSIIHTEAELGPFLGDFLTRLFGKESTEALTKAYIGVRSKMVPAIKIGVAHFDEKLFIPPFITEPHFRKMNEKFENNEGPLINVYHEILGSTENIEALKAIWRDDLNLVDRFPILNRTLDAHQDGIYELSIPVLIAQIEGYLGDIIGTTNQGQFKSKIEGLLISEEKEKDLKKLRLSEPWVFLQIIEEELFPNTDGKRSDQGEALYPRRHPIQHGQDLTYFKNPHFSTRCIILLDRMRGFDKTLRERA